MNTSNLKQQDGFFLCPKCGEYELQQVKIWDLVGRDHATDDWQCDGCGTNFVEDPKGDLILIK